MDAPIVAFSAAEVKRAEEERARILECGDLSPLSVEQPDLPHRKK
jgi:hypothetical protein